MSDVSSPEEQTFTFNLEYSDVFDFYMYGHKYEKPIRKVYSFYIRIYIIIGIIFGLAFWFFLNKSLNNSRSDFMWGLAWVDIGTYVFGIYFIYMTFLTIRWIQLPSLGWKNILATKSMQQFIKDKCTIHTLTINPDYFQCDDTQVLMQRKWQTFDHVVLMPKAIYLFVSPANACIIPRRLVDNREAWESLKETIKKYREQNKQSSEV